MVILLFIEKESEQHIYIILQKEQDNMKCKKKRNVYLLESRKDGYS